MTTARLIKKIRTSAEMTQNELADHLGVTRQRVTQFESGDLPTREVAWMLVDLAREYRVSGVTLERLMPRDTA